jgi:7-carboxy-7-deazaguanine synthase
VSGFAPPPVSRGLPISEVFGPTLQGEGPAAGRAAVFVRFGGCNLSCSWCDTPYTWDSKRFDLREEISRVPLSSIWKACRHAQVAVLTGGEPLLHQRADDWGELLRGLHGSNHEIHLETNGTIAPSDLTVQYVDLAAVSPKLPHADAGARTGQNPIVPAALKAWARVAHTGRAFLKVVVQTQDDCQRALDLARAHGFPLSSVWIMPEGTSPEALAERWPMVARFAADNGINATHRLHVLAWGDERGH